MSRAVNCGASANLGSDDEDCEAECALPAGHAGKVHEDIAFGEWDEDEVFTIRPV